MNDVTVATYKLLYNIGWFYDERGVYLYKFILRSHDELFSYGVCYALLYNPRTSRIPLLGTLNLSGPQLEWGGR